MRKMVLSAPYGVKHGDGIPRRPTSRREALSFAPANHLLAERDVRLAAGRIGASVFGEHKPCVDVHANLKTDKHDRHGGGPVLEGSVGDCA